jgi:hypothetical protein
MFAIFNYAIIVYSFFVLREVCLRLHHQGFKLTEFSRPPGRAWKRWKRCFSGETKPSRVTTLTLILSPPMNLAEISQRFDI